MPWSADTKTTTRIARDIAMASERDEDRQANHRAGCKPQIHRHVWNGGCGLLRECIEQRPLWAGGQPGIRSTEPPSGASGHFEFFSSGVVAAPAFEMQSAPSQYHPEKILAYG